MGLRLLRAPAEACVLHTDKKENQIFLIYIGKLRSGAVAKSYMKKGFLLYEECVNISPYMRRPLVIYMTLQLLHSEFPYI